MVWCEKGYPAYIFEQKRGYGHGAAPHGSCRELVQIYMLEVAKLAIALIYYTESAGSKLQGGAVDAANCGLPR